MDRNAFVIAASLGLIVQLAMILAGHYVPAIKDKGFMIGGLAISFLAGLLYAKLALNLGWPSAILDGGLAGGGCAFFAIGASVLLKDTPPNILMLGTLGSVVAGVIGGVLGKLWL